MHQHQLPYSLQFVNAPLVLFMHLACFIPQKAFTENSFHDQIPHRRAVANVRMVPSGEERTRRRGRQIGESRGAGSRGWPIRCGSRQSLNLLRFHFRPCHLTDLMTITSQVEGRSLHLREQLTESHELRQCLTKAYEVKLGWCLEPSPGRPPSRVSIPYTPF